MRHLQIILLFALIATAAKGQTNVRPVDTSSSGVLLVPTKLALIDTNLIIRPPVSEVVFTIADSTKVVTVPRGWERIIVIRRGEVWTIDSSMTKSSYPRNW